MNKEQAIKVLIDVANIAQKAGALGLQDASVVFRAISALTAKEGDGVEKVEPIKKTQK